MGINYTMFKKRSKFYAFATVMLGTTLVVSGLTSTVNAQAADSIYVAPSSGSYVVGSTFTISLRENSSGPVNAAEADLSYSTASLQFVSIDGSSSAFGIDAQSTGGSGSVSVSRGNTSPVNGDQLIAKVSFKALATGTANIQMQNSSVVLSSSTNSNVVNTRNGAAYTLSAASSPAPAPSPTPSPSPGATPSPSPGSHPTSTPSPSSKPAPSSSVTIAPQGNSQTTALPGDSVIELSTPATLQTTSTGSRTVTKVEYLVNNKVVATITQPPYIYAVDSTKYRNGSYTLTTKTHYKDGTIESSNASLVVKNPFGVKQAVLQVRHYSWILLIIILLIAVWLLRGKLGFLKRGRSNQNAYNDDSESLDYGMPRNNGDNATVAAPSTTPATYMAPAPTMPTATIEPERSSGQATVPVIAPLPALHTPDLQASQYTATVPSPTPSIAIAAPTPAPLPTVPQPTVPDATPAPKDPQSLQ